MLFEKYGSYQYSMQREEEAVKLWNQAKKVDPKNIWAYVSLSNYYLDKNNTAEAEKILAEGLKQLPEDSAKSQVLKGETARIFHEHGKYKEAEGYFEELNALEERYFRPSIKENYRKLRDIVLSHHLKLVAIQYPTRSVLPLKRLLEFNQRVIFVDNEQVFKEAVKEKGYQYYFTDSFGGSFGHCTLEGNQLLAQNISEVILNQIFKK